MMQQLNYVSATPMVSAVIQLVVFLAQCITQKNDVPPFDESAHEKEVRAFYKKRADFDIFDKLIDMALDREITMEQAVAAFQNGGNLEPIGGLPESE